MGTSKGRRTQTGEESLPTAGTYLQKGKKATAGNLTAVNDIHSRLLVRVPEGLESTMLTQPPNQQCSSLGKSITVTSLSNPQTDQRPEDCSRMTSGKESTL